MNKQEIIEVLEIHKRLFKELGFDENSNTIAHINKLLQSLTTEPQVDKVTVEDVLKSTWSKEESRDRWIINPYNKVNTKYYREDLVLQAMQTYATQSNAELTERIKLLELIIKENSSNAEEANAEAMREHAIGFAEWIYKKGYVVDWMGIYRIPNTISPIKTKEQLYNEYITTLTKKEQEKNLGNCVEKNCNEKAVIDYNGHNHFVCQRHYDSLSKYFDEEYK